MKYLRIFEEFKQESNSLWNNFESWLSTKDFELYDGKEDLKRNFLEIIESEMSIEEKSHEIAAYLDEKWGLYDGYMEVVDYLDGLLSQEDINNTEEDED
jgi:hypothetical protein